MNISKILNIVLLLILIGVFAVLATNKSNKPTEKQIDNAVIQNIHQRKSVRNYTEEKVTNEQLDTLVRAAMAAPTAMNKQPWAFILINDRAVMDSLANVLPRAQMLREAAAAVIVCGDLNKAGEAEAQQFWIQDCSAASQNILLAAQSMGLGAVWTAVYPKEESIKDVKTFFGMPENIIPLNVIPIGYPSKDENPKDKYKAENIHFNKW
ncbi:MAG: nitroreductase family protein [Flavobacteriales bacterium]|nr:nitroreductase family protein [Flavobacteriales bacterium]